MIYPILSSKISNSNFVFYINLIPLLYIFLNINTYANQPQNPDTVFVDSTFYVRILDEAAIPTDTSFGIVLTADTSLNNLYAEFNVTECRRPFLGARGEFLKKAFQITCESCNIDSLMNFMDSEFEYFSDFQRLDYINDTTSLSTYEPADEFWSQTTETDYLWHLKKIEADKAWNITTGDPNVTIGVIDGIMDYYHPDLQSELLNQVDPINHLNQGISADFTDCSLSMNRDHGTQVAVFASGQTTEQNETPPTGARSSSVGFNTKIFGYVANNLNTVAWDASFVRGADVIVNCTGMGRGCPNSYQDHITTEILNNGTSIVMPAGNGSAGANNQNTWCTEIAPVTPYPFLSPLSDDRVICVSSTTMEDKHYYEDDNIDKTHSHYEWVDLCAPGYVLTGARSTNCNARNFPYYIAHPYVTGTSFAAPITAGAVSLVKSVDPCLTPRAVKEILTATTDPIADAHLFPNEVGTGRLNVYQAVLMAQNYNSITSNDIYGNVTISGEEYVSSHITVHPGAHLTVTGEISFSSNASLIVMPNAKLTVDGGTLRASRGCKTDFWPGIETRVDGGALLWSDIEIKNNATIEGAYTGIRGWDPNVLFSVLQTSQIHVTNSTFLNCRKAIDIQSHPMASAFNLSSNLGQNQPFIVSNIFEINEHYPHPTQHPLQQVSLVSLNGARIQSNNFENNKSLIGVTNLTERGVGIYSNNSAFQATSNSFEGLYIGVEQHGSNYNGVGNITSNVFKSCYFGVHSNHNTNSSYKHNTFDANFNSGMYILGSQDFELNNNTFRNHNPQAVGLRFENTGSLIATLFDENYFNNNYNGVYFVGNNEGLTFSCNKWDNTLEYDMLFHGDAIIQYHIGTFQNNIVNYYSLEPCSKNYTHFNSALSTQRPYEFYPPEDSPSRAIPTCLPLKDDVNIDHRTNGIYTENWCEPEGIGLIAGFFPSDSPEEAESLIYEGRMEIKNLDDHIKLIQDNMDEDYDGGNTEYLLNLINDVDISEEDLTSILIDFSPKLTSVVLNECIYRSPELSSDNLFSVLVNNSPLPFETLQDSVIIHEKLQTVLYDSLWKFQEGISPLDSINQVLNNHQFKLDINVRNQVIRFLNDSNLEHGSDSVLNYLEKYRFNEEYYIPLLEASWNQMNHDLAEDLLNAISLTEELSPLYSTLQTIHDSCHIDSVSIHHLYHNEEVFRNSLASLAEHQNGRISSFARSIITHTNDTIFHYETEPIPTGAGKKDSDTKESVEADDNFEPLKEPNHQIKPIKIFPNPANNELNVNVSSQDDNISFKIMNIAGIEIKTGNLNSSTTIDISHLKSGLYFILVETENQQKTFKFVKQ